MLKANPQALPSGSETYIAMENNHSQEYIIINRWTKLAFSTATSNRQRVTNHYFPKEHRYPIDRISLAIAP